MGFNDIFTQLSVLKLAVYAPISYILPSRLRKYEEIYDTQVEGGRGKLRQADRERSLQALMTTNLLKRLESSVAAFRLTLRSLGSNISRTLDAIDEFEKTGQSESISDHLAEMSDFDPEDDDLSGLDKFTVGKKVQISLGDMDLPSWKHDLAADLNLISLLLYLSLNEVSVSIKPLQFGHLPKTTEAQVIGKQLLRSGTSVGANYREACHARSDAEFVAKIGDCLKELDETEYWIELLSESGIVPREKLEGPLDETSQLLAIFTTIVKNVKQG